MHCSIVHNSRFTSKNKHNNNLHAWEWTKTQYNSIVCKKIDEKISSRQTNEMIIFS